MFLTKAEKSTTDARYLRKKIAKCDVYSDQELSFYFRLFLRLLFCFILFLKKQIKTKI